MKTSLQIPLQILRRIQRLQICKISIDVRRTLTLLGGVYMDESCPLVEGSSYPLVSFAAVFMARTPPQPTSAEPSETFHSTKLTNDIEEYSGRSQKRKEKL